MAQLKEYLRATNLPAQGPIGEQLKSLLVGCDDKGEPIDQVGFGEVDLRKGSGQRLLILKKVPVNNIAGTSPDYRRTRYVMVALHPDGNRETVFDQLGDRLINYTHDLTNPFRRKGEYASVSESVFAESGVHIPDGGPLLLINSASHRTAEGGRSMEITVIIADDEVRQLIADALNKFQFESDPNLALEIIPANFQGNGEPAQVRTVDLSGEIPEDVGFTTFFRQCRRSDIRFASDPFSIPWVGRALTEEVSPAETARLAYALDAYTRRN